MKTSLPNELADEAQDAWQASQALSEMLIQSSDLESICRAALQFVLEKVNRPDGALIALSPQEKAAHGSGLDLLARQGSSPAWLARASSTDAHLRHRNRNIRPRACPPEFWSMTISYRTCAEIHRARQGYGIPGAWHSGRGEIPDG